MEHFEHVRKVYGSAQEKYITYSAGDIGWSRAWQWWYDDFWPLCALPCLASDIFHSFKPQPIIRLMNYRYTEQTVG